MHFRSYVKDSILPVARAPVSILVGVVGEEHIKD